MKKKINNHSGSAYIKGSQQLSMDLKTDHLHKDGKVISIKNYTNKQKLILIKHIIDNTKSF